MKLPGGSGGERFCASCGSYLEWHDTETVAPCPPAADSHPSQASPAPRGDTPAANPSGSKTAEERFGISLSLSSARLEVAPGSTARLEARVRNLGVLVNEVTVLVDGAPRPWVHVEPERVGIMPGAAEVVSVTFAPPPDVDVPAGPVPFRVIARSELHQGVTAEEHGVLDLAQVTEVNLSVCPDSSRHVC